MCIRDSILAVYWRTTVRNGRMQGHKFVNLNAEDCAHRGSSKKDKVKNLRKMDIGDAL